MGVECPGDTSHLLSSRLIAGGSASFLPSAVTVMVTLRGSAAEALGARDVHKKANSPAKSSIALRLNVFMFLLPFFSNLLDARRNFKEA